MLCTVFIRIHRKVNHEVLSVSHDPLNSSVNSWDPFKGFSFLCLLFKCKMNILLLPFLLFYNNLSTNFTHKKAFSYCRCIYFAWTLFWVIDFISDHLSFFSSVASMYLKIMKLTSFFFSSPTPLKPVPIPPRCPISSECHRHSSSYSIVNLEVFLNPSSPSDPISDKFCIFCLLNISKSSLLSPMFTTIVLVQFFFFFWCSFLFSITCITAIERKLKLCQLIHLYIKYSLSTHAVSDSEQSLRMK